MKNRLLDVWEFIVFNGSTPLTGSLCPSQRSLHARWNCGSNGDQCCGGRCHHQNEKGATCRCGGFRNRLQGILGDIWRTFSFHANAWTKTSGKVGLARSGIWSPHLERTIYLQHQGLWLLIFELLSSTIQPVPVNCWNKAPEIMKLWEPGSELSMVSMALPGMLVQTIWWRNLSCVRSLWRWIFGSLQAHAATSATATWHLGSGSRHHTRGQGWTRMISHSEWQWFVSWSSLLIRAIKHWTNSKLLVKEQHDATTCMRQEDKWIKWILGYTWLL